MRRAVVVVPDGGGVVIGDATLRSGRRTGEVVIRCHGGHCWWWGLVLCYVSLLVVDVEYGGEITRAYRVVDDDVAIKSTS